MVVVMVEEEEEAGEKGVVPVGAGTKMITFEQEQRMQTTRRWDGGSSAANPEAGRWNIGSMRWIAGSVGG